MSDAGNGEAQIAWLRNEPYGIMVEVTQCENARLPVQINVEEALLARVFPVV